MREDIPEQKAFPYRQATNGQRVSKRRSLVTSEQERVRQQEAPRHRAGHFSGLHPEDTPYLTGDRIPQRTPQQDNTLTRPRQNIYVPSDDVAEDVEEYIDYAPRSAIVRYQHPAVPHRQPYQEPPQEKSRKRFHPLVFVGIAMFIMIFGWIAINLLGTWWQIKQDDWKYGSPRTFQTDAVVGHNNDSQESPTHFLALNLNNHIVVEEIPAGYPSKAHIYPITTLVQGSADTPVTLSFRDINNDGKVDMLIQIGEGTTAYTVFLFNNGSQFVPKL